jgi:hypothetical protein
MSRKAATAGMEQHQHKLLKLCRFDVFYYTVINMSSNIRLEYHQQVMSPSQSRTSQMQWPQSEAPRIPSMQDRMSKLSKQLFHASGEGNGQLLE